MGGKKGIFSFLNLDSIFDNLSGYVEKRIDLFKIEMKEDLASASAKMFVILILSILLFIFLLFLSIAGAILLNRVFEIPGIGFLLVGGFYLIIFFIIFFLKEEFRMEEKLRRKFLDMFKDL